MAASISAGLAVSPYSKSQGRRFGSVVGGAFLLIATLFVWRGAETGALIAGGTGAALVLMALLVPRRLQRIEVLWMRLAHAISRVTTPIVLAIIFFVVITPMGVLMRLFGHHPLRRPDGESFWVTRQTGRSDLRRQF